MSKTILYSLAFVALGLISGSIGPTLPALAAQTHVEMKQISNLFVARSLGTMLGSWMIGRAYDRVTGHPLLAASLLAAAIAMAAIPVTNLLWLLLAISAFVGLASASIKICGRVPFTRSREKLVGISTTNDTRPCASRRLASVGELVASIMLK